MTDNLFLGQPDFVVDLDEHPWGDLYAVLGWLEQKPEFRLNYIIESGGGGIHVSFRRPFDGASLAPGERERLAERMNENIVAELRSAGVSIDPIVTNPRQIVNIPLSLDARSGRVCRFVDFHAPVRGPGNRSGPPGLDDAKNRRALRRCNVEQGEGARDAGRRAGVSDPPTFFTAVRSSICGTKGLHVPILELGRELDCAEETARRLIRRFNLSDVYLFDDGRKIVGVSLKPVSLRRYQKIQDAGG